jgi:hypothetical protein
MLRELVRKRGLGAKLPTESAAMLRELVRKEAFDSFDVRRVRRHLERRRRVFITRMETV